MSEQDQIAVLPEQMQGASARPIAGWKLLEIVLGRCLASSGSGDRGRLAGARQDYSQIEAHFDGELRYEVSQSMSIVDQDDLAVATIESAFFLIYDVGAGEPSAKDVDRFSRSVVLQSVPFTRELLASMSNRMGLPTFTLPMMRASEIRLAEPDSP